MVLSVKKETNKYLKYNRIYMFLLCIAVLFMNIGYALINSVTLDIAGTVLLNSDSKIFISNVDIKSDLSSNPDLNNTKVNSTYQTVLNTNVGLSSLSSDSTVVMEIKVHNVSNVSFVFDGVVTDGTTATYSNENIVYTLSGIEKGMQVLPSEYITFTITFSYKDNVLPKDGNYLLEACLNFKFSEILMVTYDANGGSFDSDNTNIVSYMKKINEVVKVSKTSNVSDDGLTFDSTGYGNDFEYTDVIIIPGAEQLEVTITYETENDAYDWVSIYDKSITPTSYNYSDSISGKLGGTERLTKTYTISGDTVQIFFRSDISISEYYGYYAVVKGIGYSSEVVSGEYVEPTHEIDYMKFSGWCMDSECIDDSEFIVENLSESVTVYADWEDTRTSQAIYSATDGSLTFVHGELYTEGDTFVDQDGNSKVITSIYTGFESDIYDSYDSPPWYSNRENIVKVVFETEIKPVSTQYWFGEFENANYFDVSKLNTSRVTNMSEMFSSAGYNVDNFEIIGLSSWNTKKVTNMYKLFNDVGSNATTWSIGDLSGWDVSNVIDMSRMFDSAGSSATTWDIGDLSNWNVSNVTSMASMFSYAGESAELIDIGDLGKWNITSVTNLNSMFLSSFDAATTLNIGKLSNWDVSSVTDMSYMFSYIGNSAISWDIGNLDNWDVSSVTNMYRMFADSVGSVSTFDIGNLSNWDVSSVSNMGSMFEDAGQLATTWNIGDLSNWNVSSVTDMSRMFSNAGFNAIAFNIGNLSNWNVSNVINMEGMFESAGYKADYYLDLSGWNVVNVTISDYFNDNVENKVIAPSFGGGV